MKIFLMLCLSFFLMSCVSNGTNFDPKASVQIIEKTIYPDLPNISVPNKPVLIPWSYSIPSNDSKLSVCLDETELNKLILTFGRLEEYVMQLESRIAVINDQREEWRTLNAKQRNSSEVKEIKQ